MISRRTFNGLGASLVTASLADRASAGADYPQRPVTLVVPYGAGGILDGVLRPVVTAVTNSMLEPMIMDYWTGADGRIGSARVLKAAPDGYTILSASVGLWVAEHLWPDAGFKTRDFVGICGLASSPSVYVASSELPVKSMEEFIAYARARPGQVAVPHAGVGSAIHLAEELFFKQVGITVNLIPYKGSGPSIADLLAGRLNFGLAYLSVILPHIKSGRVRPLAINALHRSPSLPDVPTLDELGYKEATFLTWTGVAAAAKTPAHIVDYLSGKFRKAMSTPDVEATFKTLQLEAQFMDAKTFTRMMYQESERMGKLIKEQGIKV